MFVASKIFWYVAAPGNLLVIILVLGFLALAAQRRIAFVLIAISAVGFTAIVALPIAEWVAMPLEDRFPQPALPEKIDGIILLGGAVDEAITRARGLPAVNDAAERVIETAVLARRYPEAKIVISGGEGLRAIGWSEAEPTRDILVSLGIPATRMILETVSRNTIENAENSKTLVHPEAGQTWLLVTSAMHMPRAVGCFRHVGWNVLPFPVDYRTAPGLMTRDYFLSDRVLLLELATKEWIGLVTYKMLGRIDSFFPAP